MKKACFLILLSLFASSARAGSGGSSFAGGMVGGMMGGLVSGAITKESGRSYSSLRDLQEAVRYDLLRLRDRMDDLERRLNARIHDLENRIRDLEKK